MDIRQYSLKKILLLIGLVLLVSGMGYGFYYFNRYIVTGDYEEAMMRGSSPQVSDYMPIAEESSDVKGMVLVAENATLKMYLDEETTNIAVVDKASGVVFTTNPVAASKDEIANKANKDLLMAQIEIEYYDENLSRKKMDNYGDAIENSQFEFKSIDNGIRIIYTIGNMQKGLESLPKFITEARLNEVILSKVDAKMAKNVKKQYIETDTNPGYLEMRGQVENSKIVLNQMLEAFEAAGYTEEDLAIDNGAVGLETTMDRTIFTVPLDYQLVDDRIVASINTEEIPDVEGSKITTIRLLDFFGAGSTEDEGYLFVPNGSGSLIYFNNGKVKEESYYQQVYGIDLLVEDTYVTQSSEPVRLPVYGAKVGDAAFLAEIIEGQAIASITADISGKRNSYNHAGVVFTVRDNEQLSMFGTEGMDQDLPVVEERMYQGNLAIAFKPLTGDNADYSGMANYYRSCLIKEGALKLSESRSVTPFYLDVLGAVEKKSFIMGIPYYSTFVMTDLDETKEMVEAFTDQGVENIRTRYLGWFNDGYFHDVARSVDLVGKIGSSKEFKGMEAYMENLGGGFYPDVAFMEVSLTSDDYAATFESSRFIAGVTVLDAPVHLALMRKTSAYRQEVVQIVSPQAVIKHVDGFLSDYQKLNLSSLSLRDLGDIITSDKKRQRPIDRGSAMNMVVEQFEKIKHTSSDLMVVGGNAYALPYANHVLDLPLGHNEFYLVDEAVPFYQMVLHGYVDYASEAFNIQNVYELDTAILKMVEYASAPHFILTKEETSELKKTALDDLYSTQYEDWMDDATRMYQEVASALDLVRGSSMVSHERILEGFYKTVYDNNVVIYVNYTEDDLTMDGQNIPARGYVVKRGVNQ